MILNEGRLAAAMKDAWKHGGYTVASYISEAGEQWLGIYTGYWAAAVELGNVPRKVLGLIAEHAGKLPGEEEAYILRKDEDAQNEIHAHAMAPLETLMAMVAGGELVRTQLTYNNLRVWQQRDNLDVMLINPEYTNIADIKENKAVRAGNALYVEGLVSRAWILPVMPGKSDETAVKYLSGMQWTA